MAMSKSLGNQGQILSSTCGSHLSLFIRKICQVYQICQICQIWATHPTHGSQFVYQVLSFWGRYWMHIFSFPNHISLIMSTAFLWLWQLLDGSGKPSLNLFLETKLDAQMLCGKQSLWWVEQHPSSEDYCVWGVESGMGCSAKTDLIFCKKKVY